MKEKRKNGKCRDNWTLEYLIVFNLSVSDVMLLVALLIIISLTTVVIKMVAHAWFTTFVVNDLV